MAEITRARRRGEKETDEEGRRIVYTPSETIRCGVTRTEIATMMRIASELENTCSQTKDSGDQWSGLNYYREGDVTRRQ